ncbi:MAG: DUF2075 domain-containing protein [Oscillospiraceae bacterium]
MKRAYYYNNIVGFCSQRSDEILGEVTRNNQFALEQKQRNTWIYEIALLQHALRPYISGDIAFEYTIPRIGNRIDNVFAYRGILNLIEFKVGETTYPKRAIDQVVDYALDLKYFHKESYGRQIVPIVVCTNAPPEGYIIDSDEDGVFKPICCNKDTLHTTLEVLTSKLSDNPLNFTIWLESQYMPTPTIIEAAQALYRGHDVKEISRSDSEAYNLSLTLDTINQIIERSKANHEKSIGFVTGVPGAGKTLAGLNIANTRHNFNEDEHAVFLSGNGPLVFVLREALARDEYERSNHMVKKGLSKKKAEAFIQNIHHFRDEALKSQNPPIEKVTVFDEAQRAWTKAQTAKFMAERGIHDFDMSEPEFLISAMDRHKDWAVIVCLVGGGQEINTGEAGLPAWFEALRNRFSHWKIYVSMQIAETEYTRGVPLDEMLSGLQRSTIDKLHLAVSLRSFRSERVSEFVKALLDMNLSTAQKLYSELRPKYPIVLTRSLDTARAWVKTKARGTERYGLTASSGAKRLRTFGIWVQSSITAENWFLNDMDDVRSSYFLEDTATEFDIQGLEIDWTIVAWDADYRIEDNVFVPHKFTGTRWNSVNKEDDRLYIKNAYRVLLTRARQGFVIFIPEGNDADITRLCEFYDKTYDYLRSIGIDEI